MEGARQLRKAGVEIQINSTVARHNLDQLDRLYELALGLGSAALHLFLLVPVGCGAQIAQSHTISASQYESVLGWVYDRKKAARLQLRVTCAPHYYRVESQRGGPAEPMGHPGGTILGGDSTLPGRRGCLAGVSVAFVSHRGEVFPCGYLPVQAGDLNDKPFHEIWHTSPLLLQLRDPALLAGKCGRCQYKTLCGGCRARAMSQSDNYLAEEPMCEYKPTD